MKEPDRIGCPRSVRTRPLLATTLAGTFACDGRAQTPAPETPDPEAPAPRDIGTVSATGAGGLGGARGFLDLEALDSDGYLTGTSTRRRNAFSKIEAPIGESMLLTFGGMYNTSYTHTPGGARLDQIRRLDAQLRAEQRSGLAGLHRLQLG